MRFYLKIRINKKNKTNIKKKLEQIVALEKMNINFYDISQRRGGK